MNAQQVKWASKHDWYRSTYCLGSDWVVLVRADGETDADTYNVNDGFLKRFASFIELRAWAGY